MTQRELITLVLLQRWSTRHSDGLSPHLYPEWPQVSDHVTDAAFRLCSSLRNSAALYITIASTALPKTLSPQKFLDMISCFRPLHSNSSDAFESAENNESVMCSLME